MSDQPAPLTGEFRNLLLGALPADEIGRLRPDLHYGPLVSGQGFHDRGDRIDDVYFMEEGVASLTADTFDSGSVEVGMVGREGLVGLSALLSPETVSVHRAFVQIPGAAYRLPAQVLREAAERGTALHTLCLRYAQTVMAGSSQLAACNARHDVAERLARWLLMCHDRVDGDTLPLTQEFLSLMLGVRRSGVAVSASALQIDGLIRYSRGRIVVLDRVGLEAASCRCYAVLQQNQRAHPVTGG